MFTSSRRLSAFLFLLLPFGTLFSRQSPDTEAAARKLIALERQKSDLQPNLEHLCTAIGPRLTGSPALKRANEWAAGKLREYGLANVALELFTVPTGWERGRCSLRVASPYTLELTAAQVAWTPGITQTITAPVVLFNPKTEAELAGFHGKLKGAVVLTEPPVTPRPEGYEFWTEPSPPRPIPALGPPADAAPRSEPRAEQDINRKAQELLRQEIPLARLVDSGKPHGLLNMWGSWTDSAPDHKAIPTLIVANYHYALLYRLLKQGVAAAVSVESHSRFVPGPLEAHSTVGEIRGSEKPDEIVLVGAHIDSWDLGTGATDNGTGVACVLEAARLLKELGVKPRRTIRFALFGGEEQTMGGSNTYVKNHRAEMDRMSAAFIHDSGTGRVLGTSLEDRPNCRPILEGQFRLLRSLGLMTVEPVIHPGHDPGSDHDTFNAAGVPAFVMSQDPAEYGLTHHSQADNLAYVRYDDLKQGACVLAVLALDTAQRPERFPRK